MSIGGLGPVLSLVVYLTFSYNMKERHDYFDRLIKIKGISVDSWIWVVAIPIIITFVPIIIDGIFINKGIDIFNIFVFDNEFFKKGSVYVIFLLFFGPVPEEMAWRGVAFNELLKKGYLKAQLIVGLLWGLWHIPLFFIEGSYQFELGMFTLNFWMFFINVIFVSLITGWVYIKSKKSILIVIIFHYLINLTGEMFFLSTQGQLIKFVIICVLGVVLVSRPLILKETNCEVD